MNNYNTYGGYYRPPYQPPRDVLPVPKWEKKRIRSVYSGTAWLFLLSEILAYIFAMIFYSIIYGSSSPRMNADGYIVTTPSVIIYGSFSVTLSLIVLTLIYSAYTHRKFTDLFNTEKLSAEKLLLTVFIALGMAQVCYLIDFFLSSVLYSAGYEYNPMVADPDTAAGWVLEVIATVITAPIFEELFYRGVIMRNAARVNKKFAVFLSAAIFGLAHGNPYQFVLGFLVGIVFGYADIKMNSIIPSILAHMAVNAHTFISYAYAGQPDNIQTMLQLGEMLIFFIGGIIALVIALSKYKLESLPSNGYYRKRTMPILITSIPAWVTFLYMLYTTLSSLTPIE